MDDATDAEVLALASSLAQRLVEVPFGDLNVDLDPLRDAVIIGRAVLLMGEMIENGSDEERFALTRALGLGLTAPSFHTP